MAHVWIGTSGWSYKHWEKGKFYPPELAAADFLPFFATHFSTVEINYSYYQLPPRKTFELWRRKAPPGFLFSVKASRYLTHMKKLKDPAEPLERLLHNARGLGKTFGPVLFQFPRQWKLDLARLQEFMLTLHVHPAHRYTFEFRHRSWLVPEVYAVLRDSNAALVPARWLGHSTRRAGHGRLDVHPLSRWRAQPLLRGRRAGAVGGAHSRVAGAGD